jgi:hypothetical protein
MSRDISTSTNIHPHSKEMSFDLHHMPQFGTTTFKVVLNDYNAINIFLPMTPQELIALLEEQVANLVDNFNVITEDDDIEENNVITEDDDITETDTESDESTELKTFAEKFNASPIGLVVNNILNK